MAVRLRDVAERAGVSVKTVSNVVHGHPSVSRSMRERVQTSIAALGYVPNMSARSLRTGRSGLVGLAVPHLSDPYFSGLAAAVIDVSAARGVSVLVEQTAGDPVRETDVLLGRRPTIVDALIFSPISVTREALDDASPAVPLVLLGEHLMASQRDRVAIDNVAAATEAVAHLVAGGRRRIAAIGAKRGSTAATAELRLEGYRRAVAAAGLTPDPALEVATEQFSRASGAAAVHQLLDAGTEVDALFCFNDLLALGAIEALRTRGSPSPATWRSWGSTTSTRVGTPTPTSRRWLPTCGRWPTPPSTASSPGSTSRARWRAAASSCRTASWSAGARPRPGWVAPPPRPWGPPTRASVVRRP